MAKKTNKTQATQQRKPKTTDKEGISSSGAIILAAVIGLIGVVTGAVLNYRSEQNKIYAPIYATQTAQSSSQTQTALAFESNPLAISTPTVTLAAPQMESATPVPSFGLQIVTPTMDNLNLAPIIYVGYRDITTPGTLYYPVKVSSKNTYLWTYAWCAKLSTRLNENLAEMEFSFFIDDIEIPEDKFLVYKDTSPNGWPCQKWATLLSGWDIAHAPTLAVVYYVPAPLSDGAVIYPIGEYRHEIDVNYID